MLRIEDLRNAGEKALEDTHNALFMGSANVRRDLLKTGEWSKALVCAIRENTSWVIDPDAVKFPTYELTFSERKTDPNLNNDAADLAARAYYNKAGNCEEKTNLTIYFLINQIRTKPEFKAALERGDIALSTKCFHKPSEHVFVQMDYKVPSTGGETKTLTVYIDPWVNVNPVTQQPMVFTPEEFKNNMTIITDKLRHEEFLSAMESLESKYISRWDSLIENIIALIETIGDPIKVQFLGKINLLIQEIRDTEMDFRNKHEKILELKKLFETEFIGQFPELPELAEEVTSWVKIINEYRSEMVSINMELDEKYSPSCISLLTPEGLIPIVNLHNIADVQSYLDVFQNTCNALTQHSDEERKILAVHKEKHATLLKEITERSSSTRLFDKPKLPAKEDEEQKKSKKPKGP